MVHTLDLRMINRASFRSSAQSLSTRCDPANFTIFQLLLFMFLSDTFFQRQCSLSAIFHAHTDEAVTMRWPDVSLKSEPLSLPRLFVRFLNDNRLRTIRRENENGRRRNAGAARGPLR